MSGVRLEYSIDNSKPLAMLQRLEDFNARAMFDDIGGYLDSEVTNRFVEGKDPDGNLWEQSERAKNEGGSTLVDYGHLRDSITHFVFLDGSGLEQGTDMVYAAIHQFGGEAGRNHSVTLPARPYIGINDDDEVEIDNIVEDHYRRALQ